MDFLKDLNEVQQKAVTSYKGPGLVIAGAGSGKTRVLTYRIAYLLKQGIKPHTILPLTFTNKAAREMKERIAMLVGHETARKLWMGTFHSIFARILRHESESIGYPSNYIIYDTIDAKNLIRSIIKERKLDDKIYKVSEIMGRISSAKNNLITARAYNNSPQFVEQDRRNGKSETGTIFQIYMARCYKAGAMDFDDLLLNTNILFRDFPDVLEKYQNRFHYILVDEYQDTNFAQYLIIKKLAEKHQNICVVGDDAQSIYSFRGAKIENILNFRNDYPGYQIFKLEQNYRSTKNIVNAANSLIDKNKEQIKKTVWSSNETGEKIKVIKVLTDNEEGYMVSNQITDLRHSQHFDYKDFAILYRTNAQSRIFEEVLRRNNIPYKVYGSISFYQRKEIKDMLAYFRLVINSQDDEALKRIINYPTRGIGKKSQEKIEAMANQHEVSLWEVVENPVRYKLEITKAAYGRIAGFIDLIKGFSSHIETSDAYGLGNEIAGGSGILRELSQDNTPEAISKYENVQELLNGMKEFSLNFLEENGKQASLTDYMENVSLLTDTDNEKPEDFDKVTMMTIHSAKGLEFSNVFVTGLEEDLFPSRMSMSIPQNLEEERRLFYVALTRAKRNAFLSFTQSRYRYGTPTVCRPSRFIKEIDDQFLEISKDAEMMLNPDMEFDDAGFEHQDKVGRMHPGDMMEGDNLRGNNKGQQFRNTGYKDNRENRSDSGKIRGPEKFKNFKNLKDLEKNKKNNATNLHDSNNLQKFAFDDPDKIQVGMIVEHSRFGKGKVLALEGTAPNNKATVFFNNAGQRQLLLKFAKLKIIN